MYRPWAYILNKRRQFFFLHICNTKWFLSSHNELLDFSKPSFCLAKFPGFPVFIFRVFSYSLVTSIVFPCKFNFILHICFCPVREEVSQSSMAKTTKQIRRNVQATIFLIGWHWSYTESSFWRTDSTEIRSSGLYSQRFSVKSHTLHSKDWIEVPVLVFIHYFIRQLK